MIRTAQTTTATDTVFAQAQNGYHRFDHCPHFLVEYCVFGRKSNPSLNRYSRFNLLTQEPLEVAFVMSVPGSRSWGDEGE